MVMLISLDANKAKQDSYLTALLKRHKCQIFRAGIVGIRTNNFAVNTLFRPACDN